MLRSAQLQGATTQQAVLKFIGKKQPHEILSKVPHCVSWNLEI